MPGLTGTTISSLMVGIGSDTTMTGTCGRLGDGRLEVHSRLDNSRQSELTEDNTAQVLALCHLDNSRQSELPEDGTVQVLALCRLDNSRQRELPGDNSVQVLALCLLAYSEQSE